MPRHLISDAHEWINEIPTVPTYYLANPQAGERACSIQRGKKTLLSLTLVSLCDLFMTPSAEKKDIILIATAICLKLGPRKICVLVLWTQSQ